MRPWADQLQTTLNAVLPTPLRPTDLTDDRLANVLHALSDDAAWAACEGELNQHLLRVYDLTPTTMRVDSTTASGYGEATADGLFPNGNSQDQRPDLPQVKVMLATLDPLGMPVAVDVVPGQRNDEPLYRPIIDRVRTRMQHTGLRDVGDSKLGGLQTRAALHAAGDASLCPLGQVQLPAPAVNALIEQALAAGALTVISRPDADGHVIRDDAGQPVVHAAAWETGVDLTTTVDGQTITWACAASWCGRPRCKHASSRH